MSFYIERRRVVARAGGENLAKQSHKSECDIYNILRQYSKTGMINHINKQSPQYDELPDDVDFQQSMNTIIQAESAFASLPAKVRKYFDNSPSNFLASFSDPSQHDMLREWGLLRPARPADPAPALDAGAAPSS